jgi:hypothetical protein
MRKLTLLGLLVLVLLASCDKKVKRPDSYPLYVSGVDYVGVKHVADGRRYEANISAPMTALQVLLAMLKYNEQRKKEYGDSTDTYCGDLNFYSLHKQSPCVIGLHTDNIDTVGVKLVFHAINLSTLDDNEFINPNVSKDLTISVNGDTLAYIPNAQREAAYAQIRELWDDEDWDAMYEIFENGLQFIPCTAAEYEELKARGEN